MRPRISRLGAAIGAALSGIGLFLALRYINESHYRGAWGSYWIRATWAEWRLTPWAEVYLVVAAALAVLFILWAARGFIRSSTMAGLLGCYAAAVGITMLAVPRFEVLATRFHGGTTQSFIIGIRGMPNANLGILLGAVPLGLIAALFSFDRVVLRLTKRKRRAIDATEA